MVVGRGGGATGAVRRVAEDVIAIRVFDFVSRSIVRIWHRQVVTRWREKLGA